MLRHLFSLICLTSIGCTPYQINPDSPYAKSRAYSPPYYYHKFTDAKTSKPKVPATDVKITQIKYEKLPGERGFWSGFMEGEGEYNLRLNFYKKSRILQTKNIGYQTLNLEEGPIWFKFNSSLPKTQNYTWKIEAYRK